RPFDGVATSEPSSGGLPSRRISSEAALSFPHTSRRRTVTVRVPVPPASVQAAGDASAMKLVQVVVFEMHIVIGVEASVAVIVSVTLVVAVAVAPALIETVPAGAVNSGAGRPLPVTPLDRFPAASTAHTR